MDRLAFHNKKGFDASLEWLGLIKRSSMELMSLLSTKPDVLKMMEKKCLDMTPGSKLMINQVDESITKSPKSEIAIFLSDVSNHLLTNSQNLERFEKILSRSHGNYLTQLQVESMNANNRVNDMLSKNTLIGAALVPLNVITSFLV